MRALLALGLAVVAGLGASACSTSHTGKAKVSDATVPTTTTTASNLCHQAGMVVDGCPSGSPGAMAWAQAQQQQAVGAQQHAQFQQQEAAQQSADSNTFTTLMGDTSAVQVSLQDGYPTTETASACEQLITDVQAAQTLPQSSIPVAPRPNWFLEWQAGLTDLLNGADGFISAINQGEYDTSEPYDLVNGGNEISAAVQALQQQAG